MFLFRWVMKTFLNPCFNPSLTTCPTTSAPWHKPLSLCKVSPAPCCGIQEELGGQVKTMHGECNRADWSVLCPTAVLCHLENYLAGDLGPGVLHVELAWGTVTKQEEIPVLGTLLILPRWWATPTATPAFLHLEENTPSPGGFKIWREVLGVMSSLNVRGWRICYTGQAFGFDCLTLLVSHLNTILNCFFSCMYVGIIKKKYQAAALISLSPWSLFLTKNSCTKVNGKDLPCKKQNSNVAWN